MTRLWTGDPLACAGQLEPVTASYPRPRRPAASLQWNTSPSSVAARPSHPPLEHDNLKNICKLKKIYGDTSPPSAWGPCLGEHCECKIPRVKLVLLTVWSYSINVLWISVKKYILCTVQSTMTLTRQLRIYKISDTRIKLYQQWHAFTKYIHM